MTIKLRATFENIYEDGEEVTNVYDLDVPEPEVGLNEDQWEEWAYDNLFPWTGTGREDGDAGYFVTIDQCEARPDLVGKEFEWGT